MRPRIRDLRRTPPLALAGILLALGLALFFALRILLISVHWFDEPHRGPAPQGWMTPGYLGYTWSIDTDSMLEALDVDPRPEQRLTLYQLAARKGIPQQDFLVAVTNWLEDNADDE
ncbi:hypothetical protein [Pseudooceanicola algae]|uniref:Uncharacterized protein n=1 Tax=Pseudooceanicola algae TaxID=1537215 RepID=A0A418SE03_9RHOB|nr:hypothetical protein [Pseudooceanicola algae]QPM89439.1 hypothetical protein PSAL_006580 [Pseudooceanicola algae]